MLKGLDLFGMGYSWGGYESLIIPTHPERYRTATTWQAEGPVSADPRRARGSR